MRVAEMALADQRAVLAVTMLALVAPAIADEEEEVTDMEFLEYLGSWEESDEEWQLLEDVIMVNNEDAPTDETDEGESETEDEG